MRRGACEVSGVRRRRAQRRCARTGGGGEARGARQEGRGARGAQRAARGERRKGCAARGKRGEARGVRGARQEGRGARGARRAARGERRKGCAARGKRGEARGVRGARHEGRGARGAQRAARGERRKGCAARGKRGEAQGVCSARQEGRGARGAQRAARGERRKGCAARGKRGEAQGVRSARQEGRGARGAQRAARGERRKGCAARGKRGEAQGVRGARHEAHGATIRCTVVGRPALVASFLSPRPTRAQPRCAPIIPFIAGQWSLRGGDAAWQRHAPRGRSRAAPRSFPSLRGSGRFAVATRRGSATPHAGAAALRPDHSLHCGAVVASQWRRGAAAPRPTRAQPRCAPIIIPFIAGQWSLRSGDAAGQRHAPRGRSRAAPLSLSPSLRGSGRFAVATRRGSATPHAGAAALRPYHYPLHCGAVVASCVSPRTPGIFASGLNPLHCGAVVASHERLPPNQRRYRVSIPFIAGQWSLRSGDAARQRHAPRGRSRAAPLSLSPSLRGSGRFETPRLAARRGAIKFQSPSLRGSGRFQHGDEDGGRQAAFQSPSLRGSGRFEWE
jgi:hypothetical protein